MSSSDAGNKAFYWAAFFLQVLKQQGLEHIIISPGSRSTPLTMAAAASEDLCKHVVLDERSAAYMALGIGKSTNNPPVLICTSGTAVANYFPAVIEARSGGVPLLLLTADRPPHLHHSGANQSIDQQKIYGQYPVFFHDVGEPSIDKKGLESLQRLAAQSVHHAKSQGGPVHINFPFRKPLEPDKEYIESFKQDIQPFELKNKHAFSSGKEEEFSFQPHISSTVKNAENPLIVIGQLAAKTNLQPIFDLARQLSAPVLSEQGVIDSKFAIQGFDGFLRNPVNRRNLKPDVIFRFGCQPASKSLLQALASWTPEAHIYLSDSGEWTDVENATTDFIDWNGECFDNIDCLNLSDRWLKKWKKTEQNYFERASKTFTKQETLTDGHIYHHIAPMIPESWTVFVSNSFPARDHSMFGQWRENKVFTNRGASGIDGITSTAMGVNIGSRQAGILFTGDLAFLHDLNALLNHKKLVSTLVIVVINNQGGSIFRMLPIAEHQKYFNPYFETPQEVNISRLAQSFEIHRKTINTIDQLEKFNLKDFVLKSEQNLHLIECVTDPEASMRVRKNLWEASYES